MNRSTVYRSQRKAEISLSQLIQQTANGPLANHPYLEDARSSRRLTYAQLATDVTNWKKIFLHFHLVPQAPVLVDIADPLCFSLVYLAAIANGQRVIPVDPDSPWTELHRLSELIGGAALVVSDRSEMGTLADVPILKIDPPNPLPASIIPDSLPGKQSNVSQPGSVVLFTSGSTGIPKGVELPEAQLLYVAQAIATHNHLQTSDRGFNSLPLFHVNAEVVGLLATLVAGATLVLDKRFHRQGFWELLAERHITWLNAVPAILAVLARSNDINPPSSLRFIRSASAPLPDIIRQTFATEFVVSYGMTEGASQITATPLGQEPRPGSVGLPIGNQLEIRDQQGQIIPVGQVGVVWVKGPGIINNYLFGRASERFDSAGWLCTGDVGKIDGDGYVYLMGRMDDVINRGGEKLYPAEIEDVLLQDPQVREAVVVARNHDILGQVPIAYIVPVAPLGLDAIAQLQASLAKRCQQSLTPFKRPTELMVIEDLPRAATGKIQRVKVRQLANLSITAQ